MTNEEKKKKRETSEEKKAMLTEDAALGEIASDAIFERDPELAKELAEDRKIQERALEYKKLQEERARKRKKHIIIALIIILIIIIASVMGYKIYQAKKESENSEAIVQAGEGQELVYAQITKIAGNNITVTLLEEASADTMSDSDKTENSETSENSEESRGQKGMNGGNTENTSGTENSGLEADSDSDNASSDGEMPSGGGMRGSSSDGEMPSGGGMRGSSSDGEMPSGGGMPGGSSDTEMSGNMPSQDQESGSDNTTVVNYVETETDVKYQIPVGTVVITKLGTSATFTSLSTGNVIAMAVESNDTSVIEKVWIIQ
ncbi:MAG: hypothetical protein K6B41_06190 [Butyrivibrio sp.]|nr:hypothetical protein [Butyrivibrio sp.]